MKIYKILLFLVLNLFIQFNSLAQDVCNGQSKQEKEYQTFCGKDTCFRSTAFGGKCEPATEKKRLEIALGKVCISQPRSPLAR